MSFLINPYRFATTTASYSATVLADSPLGYWRLGDASGSGTVADSSGNARHGTYVNSPTRGVTGLLARSTDTAVQFDGVARYGEIADAAWMDVGTASLESWFATTSTVARFIGGRWGASAADQHLFIDLSTSDVVRVYGNISGTTRITSATVTGLRNGLPHHIVGTYNGANLTLYIDGAQVATNAWAGTLNTGATQSIRIGSRGGGSDHYSGVLDEFAFYGSALSAARVAAHYAAGI